MDEFSWFVGLWEGEGTVQKDGKNIVLEIKMTDEDVIARAAKYLGVSYCEKKVAKPHYKPSYRVRVKGGCTRGKLYDLLMKMKPHVSKRRKEQIDTKLNMLVTEQKTKL